MLCGLALVGPTLAGDGSDSDNLRLLPDIYPVAPVDPLPLDSPSLREPYHPAFDIDWSVALRGAYAKTDSGERFDVLLAPRVSLDHDGSRSQIHVEGSAEVDKPTQEPINVSGLRLGLQAGYALDSTTVLDTTADLALTRQQPGTPGLANDITIAPQTFVGSVSAGVTRQFGRFNVGVSGVVERSLYGETTHNDGSVTDNSEQDFWALDGGLRLGFQATPIFEIFTEANLERELFDHPSSTLQVKPDATNMAIKAGVAGQWSEVLSAEASVGLGLRRFDAAALGEVGSQLYDARLVFSPDPTWRFVAALTTDVAPPGPNADGTTRVRYGAKATADYTVNSWLALRALADWSTAQFDGSSDTQTGYGYGVGADYKFGRHTALSADYGFAHADSTKDGPQDSHRVTVGVTVKR